MLTVTLNKEQIYKIVSENKYKVDPKDKFLCRCIDDRYQDDLNLSPLAFPGADAGQLALLFATAHSFGFEIDNEKVFSVLTDVLGGVHNLHFHTDNKNIDNPIGGCGHFSQIQKDPESYSISTSQIEFINKKVALSINKGAVDTVLAGEHHKGAIIQIRGNWNIYPSYVLDSIDGGHRVGFFEYHTTLIGQRHKALAKKLIEDKAAILYEGCDEEWLFESLQEMSDNHFMETTRRLAKKLPIYQVSFSDDGDFKIEDMGIV